MYKVQRYKRGQIWMADIPFSKDNKTSHIQGGRRPVLIFSSDEGNLSNEFITAIALTSQSKPQIPVNITFVQEDGMTKNTILCNQIFCLSKTKLLSYMFTIPDELMCEVQKAFNIAHDIPNMSEFIRDNITQMKHDIEDIHVLAEDNYLRESDAEKALVEIESEIRKVSQDLKARWFQILDKLNNPDTHENKIQPDHRSMSHMRTGFMTPNKEPTSNTSIQSAQVNDVNSIKPATSVNEQSNKINKTKRSKSGMPKGYWTNPDNIRKFIQDKEELSIDELASKYKFDNSDRCMKAYYNYKWKLKQYENK